MTKIAIISDIHANMHALQAVVNDLRRIAPDQVIVNGDSVGRGPQAEDVLDVITGQGWTIIKGNHEQFWMECASGATPPEWTDNWWKPTRMQIEAMPPRWFEWMATLPEEYIIEQHGAPSIQVVHGSPRRLNEGLYPHTSEEALLATLDNTPHPIVVGAHTHYMMERQAGPYRVLNCGSVGAPFNNNPAAQYLLLIWRQGAWHAEFREVPYDHLAALRYWVASGYYASGVAAQIFAHELETATFHFWHYVWYCEANTLRYNQPDSFRRYRTEFPGYRWFCEEHNLPLHDMKSAALYQHQQKEAG